MQLTKYTGVAIIDELITAYIERNSYYDPYAILNRPLTDLLDASNAYCMCEDVSRDFLAFASDWPVRADLLRDQDPATLGFTEKLDLPHTVARVFAEDGRYFTVDFTGSQYGRAEAVIVLAFG